MANDATVKGGTSYPISVTKSLRAQDIARFSLIKKNSSRQTNRTMSLQVSADPHALHCGFWRGVPAAAVGDISRREARRQDV